MLMYCAAKYDYTGKQTNFPTAGHQILENKR
jgi:hypothetical protein